jgi:hypothetical protein
MAVSNYSREAAEAEGFRPVPVGGGFGALGSNNSENGTPSTATTAIAISVIVVLVVAVLAFEARKWHVRRRYQKEILV